MSDLEKYKDILNHQTGSGDADEMADFLSKSSLAEVPAKKSKQAIWEGIEAALPEDETKRIPVWRYVGIAASISLLAVAYVLFFNEPEEIVLTTLAGEARTEILPDGSSVMLNASSSISYSEDWNRELVLDGEAFFEVTKGEKFVVQTAVGNVEVLGTSFNVYARDKDFEVACKTGKVQVTIPQKAFSEALDPGQIVDFKLDTIRRVDRLPELMGKWQAGEFYFNNQPIREVFEEMQRQFDIEIVFEGSEDYVFEGYFTNKNLENALDMVCLPLGLQYQKTGQKIFAVRETDE